MRFSLVVPFYNSKDYFSTCIESLLAQTYLKRHARNVEIILVDNNSTDGTNLLASQYARQSARKYNHLIKILRCSTWGASAARNLGIRVAKGDYVWCIDSDDWIEPDALEKLAAKLDKPKTSPDVVTFCAIKDYDAGVAKRGKAVLKSVGKGQKDWQNRFVMYGFGPWQYIARRKWLLDNELFFDEGIIHEDMALISSFVLYSRDIYALDDTLYHYVQRSQSVLHRKEWNPHAFDIFPALKKLHRRFERQGYKYSDALEYFFIWNLLLDSTRNFKQFPEGKPGLKRIRHMMCEYYPNWRHNTYLKNKPLKFRLRCRLAYRGITR